MLSISARKTTIYDENFMSSESTVGAHLEIQGCRTDACPLRLIFPPVLYRKILTPNRASGALTTRLACRAPLGIQPREGSILLRGQPKRSARPTDSSNRVLILLPPWRKAA